MLLEQIFPFIIASALGFAIGLERERRGVAARSMGLRSFVLLALLGALTAVLESSLMAAVIALFVSGLIIAGYLRTSRSDQNGNAEVGLTSELAAGATYLLGYFAHSAPWLSAILGILIFAILWNRKTLHQFSREKIKPEEIQATLILAALVIAIRPLLPEEAIDPWGIIHIKTLVTMIALILSIQFASYILIQSFGGAVGVPLWGLLAGFVSSTAVVFLIPSLLKQEKIHTQNALAAALLATASSLGLLIVLVTMISESLFWHVLGYTGPAILIALMSAWFCVKRGFETTDLSIQKNPIALWPAIKLALAIGSVILMISGIQHFFGQEGTLIASFAGGLGELHAVTISIAALYKSQNISIEQAKLNILVAVVASIISKLGITVLMARNRYSLYFSGVACLMIGVIIGSWWIILAN